MAKKVVASEPLNEDMQSIIATLAMQKGDLPAAVGIYEKLYNDTKDIKYLYAQGITYVEGGMSEKGLAIAEQLLAFPDNEIKTIPINLLSMQGKQPVRIKAAALLIKAAIQLQPPANNKAKAYEYLKECIAIQPDFEVAQNLANQYFKQ